jgi:hypothetical protein
MKVIGAVLMLVGLIGMSYGLWATYVTGILATMSIIAIAVSVVCGILLLVGFLLLYFAFSD